MKFAGSKVKKSSVGRMLIAIYILAVLAISATTRAQNSDNSSLDQVLTVSN